MNQTYIDDKNVNIINSIFKSDKFIFINDIFTINLIHNDENEVPMLYWAIGYDNYCGKYLNWIDKNCSEPVIFCANPNPSYPGTGSLTVSFKSSTDYTAFKLVFPEMCQ